MTGADKKLNFPVLKHIRITESQDKNWDPKAIRDFLDVNTTNSEINENFKKYRKIVIDLLDGKNISEEDYAYLTRDY